VSSVVGGGVSGWWRTRSGLGRRRRGVGALPAQGAHAPP
jgi:hypothetical protein